MSHAVLGAVSAYVNGGNAIGGALAGGGSEAAAQHLVKELYPEAIDEKGVFHRERLTEQQVENLVALTNAVGTVIGGVSSGLSGGDGTSVLADASTSGVVAENAVENNLFGGSYGSYRALKSEEELRKTDPKAYAELKKYQIEFFDEAAGLLITPYGVASDYYKANTLSEKAFAFAALIPGEKLAAKGYRGAKALFEHAAGLYQKGYFGDAYHTLQQAVKELKQADALYATAHGPSIKVPKDKIPDHVFASKGSSLPVPKAKDVELKTGEKIKYQSNPKHSPGGEGYNKGAGTEPKNSLDLFENSVVSGKKRYAKDAQGHVHQFTNAGDGSWHWAGSTADAKVPLNPEGLPTEIKREFGIKSKGKGRIK